MKTRLCKVLLVPLALAVYYIIVRIIGFGIPCIFRVVTGFKCPGCGVSRMLMALLQLDLKGAFLENRVLFVLLPLLVFIILRAAYLYVTQKKPGNTAAAITKILYPALIVILLLWGVLRNIWHM